MALSYLFQKSKRCLLHDLDLLEKSGWSKDDIRDLINLVIKKKLKKTDIKEAFSENQKLSRQNNRLAEKVMKLEQLSTTDSLLNNFGYRRSIDASSSIDAEGNPIPWITYPAIEYLRQLDFSNRSVFEFGSGNSTLFWAARAQKLISVEHDPAWHAKLSPNVPTSVIYKLIVDRDAYTQSILDFDGTFDVIIIDGGIDEQHRAACVETALKKLSDKGFILFDNSDWFPNSAAKLRAAGLIEVDMQGLGPINQYAWTTSFFFKRGVVLDQAGKLQPAHGPAAIKAVYD